MNELPALSLSQEHRLAGAVTEPHSYTPAANTVLHGFREPSLHLILQAWECPWKPATNPGMLPQPLEVLLNLAQTSVNSALFKLPSVTLLE